jgi:glycerate kinase
LACFAGAKLSPGFALFAQYAGLPERIATANLVLTGEGSLDSSTLMGKGVGELASLCAERRVPAVALAGVVPQPEQAARLFSRTYALTPDFTASENALRNPAEFLQQLSAKAAADWTASPV